MRIPPWVVRNSPTILTVAGSVGVVVTAVLAVRGTMQAANRIGEKLVTMEEDEGLTRKEIVQVVWPAYVPALVTGVAAITCIVGANQIGMRRNAALVAACAMVDTAFQEYKGEVLEQIGKARERKVTDEVAAKKIDENPVTDKQVIITGGGDQLTYDSLSGRYFKSSVDELNRAALELNTRILGDFYASLNDFYDLLGLEQTKVGDMLGWNVDNQVELTFTSKLAADGTPCLAITYRNLPRVDYGKF